MLMALAAGLVVNLALNCWWLPRWGVAGASLASSVSYGLQLWISWYAVRRLVHHVQPNQQGQSRGSE
jgi:O-antigen/teichoic acid export membrane protein